MEDLGHARRCVRRRSVADALQEPSSPRPRGGRTRARTWTRRGACGASSRGPPWDHGPPRLESDHGFEIHSVGTTAIGTVVATGSFGGTLRAGGHSITAEGTDPFVRAFVVAIEASGAVRWLRTRVSPGPMAVDPIGRIALLDDEGVASARQDCTTDLVRWDLTGKELWRRPLVSCDPLEETGKDARGAAVAIGLDSQIWAQGDATAAFDPGTGTMLVPRARDWFLLRVAP